MEILQILVFRGPNNYAFESTVEGCNSWYFKTWTYLKPELRLLLTILCNNLQFVRFISSNCTLQKVAESAIAWIEDRASFKNVTYSGQKFQVKLNDI